MKRFFVEDIDAKGGTCTITGAEARHITRALRMGRGDRLILMDRKGTRFEAVIAAVQRQEVLVELKRPVPPPRPSPVHITLCQALLKAPAMDLIVEKTSELGVNCVLPFLSERTVVRPDRDRILHKQRRWREIARSAAKQADRPLPAEIRPLTSLPALLEEYAQVDAIKAILWEEEGNQGLKDLLRGSTPLQRFIGVVGPEGGFTREEVRLAVGRGFTSVSLGERILRAETAAITLAAVVQYEWGDLG